MKDMGKAPAARPTGISAPSFGISKEPRLYSKQI
jgi:hypothetical protein